MTQTAVRYYLNLREYLAALEDHGKLIRISRAINKDSELHPLVRLQFRGLPESQRRAFLFENVIDSKGRKYTMPVAVGCSAASRDIYAIGMQVSEPAEIHERWLEAQTNPIAPIRASSGPVHDYVYTGGELERVGGIAMLPVPISTPGFDNAPYTTASHWLSRDPDSGRYNLGNYRGQIKAPLRMGCFASWRQDMAEHWQKYRARGEPMPAALILGAPPNLGYCAAAKLPPDVDEYHVAGGIARQPVELVQCKTVDLEVPAEAEIVVEGYIPTDSLEFEGPFGEFPGYMAKTEMTLFMNVTALTHRKDPVFQAFISQFPPSESTVLRGVALESVLLKRFRVDYEMDNVVKVAMHESAGCWALTVIQVHQPEPGQAVRIFEALPMDARSKLVIVVDDDIDARDADAINWALAFRFQPLRDTRMIAVPEMPLDPSLVDPADASARKPFSTGESRASSMLLDATRKWSYPPTSLPGRHYMERALELWREEGLPSLQLRSPWYGVNFGFWPEERQREAELAVTGEYFATGEKFARLRQPFDVSIH